MPLLSIPNTFTPNTTAYSGEVNANFNAIVTLLNSTKLDSANLQTDAVVTVNITDANVTAAKLASDSVTTAKILNANVTRAKLEAVGQQVSSSSGAASVTTLADITNLTVTITTTGRPVLIAMTPDGTTSQCYLSGSGGSNANVDLAILRGVTTVAAYRAAFNNQANNSISITPMYLDTPAAGTYTYKAQAAASTGTATFNNFVLSAREL